MVLILKIIVVLVVLQEAHKNTTAPQFEEAQKKPAGVFYSFNNICQKKGNPCQYNLKHC